MHRTPVATRSRNKNLASKMSVDSAILNNFSYQDANKTFAIDDSDSNDLIGDLLHIPDICRPSKEITDETLQDAPTPFIYNSQPEQSTDILFDRIKSYIDEKFADITKNLIAEIDELKDEIRVLKQNDTILSSQAKTSKLRVRTKDLNKSVAIQTESNQDESKFGHTSKIVDDHEEIKLKCRKLEMERNLNVVVLENIHYNGRVSGFKLANCIFRAVGFDSNEDILEYAKVYNMKDGKKRLIMGFYSKMVRSNFMNLFDSFGSVRNCDLGFHDNSYIYMKERLTADNFRIHSRAGVLLREGVIGDYLTYLGHVFVLPIDACPFDWNNYVKINDFNDLDKFDMRLNN